MADRFGWIAATRAAKVSAHVEGAVGEWLSDWHRMPPPVRVEAVEPVSPGDGYVASSTLGALGLSVREPDLAAWLLDDLSASNGALPNHVGMQAIDDLCSRLWGMKGGAQRHEGELPAVLLQPSLGALCFRIEAGLFVAFLCLGREAIDRLAPSSFTTRGMQGVALRDAMHASTTTIRAVLDLGDISLADVQGMKPGDVLVTQASLEALAQLSTVTGAPPFAHARLGGHHGRRALRLVDR